MKRALWTVPLLVVVCAWFSTGRVQLLLHRERSEPQLVKLDSPSMEWLRATDLGVVRAWRLQRHYHG